MKIVNKNHFNTLATEFQSIILEDGVNIKTTRIKELLAESQGYKTSNGLIHDLPIIFKNTSAVQQVIANTLMVKHQVQHLNLKQCIDTLQQKTRNKIMYSPLGNTGFEVGYDCVNDEKSPLVKKGEGSLDKGIAFLTILPNMKIISPHVATKLEDIDLDPYEELNLRIRIQIPTHLSFKQIHAFINDKDTLNYLSRLNKGFSCTNQPTKQIGSLKFIEGELTDDAKTIEQELKAYALKVLGKPLKPVINI